MPAVLTERRFFDDQVPAAWEPVLEDLKRFVELEDELRAGGKTPPTPEQHQELLDLHDRLVDRSAGLLEPRAMEDVGEHEVLRHFATAVLYLARLAECIHHDHPVIDTAGSRALREYEADFYCTQESLDALHRHLEEDFGVAPEELEELADEVRFKTGDARRKQAVSRALREVFGLHPGVSDMDARAHGLFDALFPGVPLAPEETRLILTGTLVFFCLPFEDEQLTTARYEGLPEEEKAPIREFLRDIRKFKQERFAHFPAFGFFREDGLDPELTCQLAELADLDPREVEHEIRRMVTIVPLGEVDKYVVHDVWGHSWQGSMLRFAQAYEAMSRYSRRLELEDRTTCPDGRTLSLGECFRRGGSEVRLDAPRLEQFILGVLRERLPLALSAVLAEVMADVAEFKLLAEEREMEGVLQNSSYLSAHPSKLDLTLQDVEFYFHQATRSFRLFARSRRRREATEAALIERGASPASARQAVEQAVEVWRGLEAGVLARELTWRREGDVLHTNVFTRVMLNFLGIHRAILLAYRELHEHRPSGLHLKGYKDLLVIGASVFFEADRSRNLWRVDEFLSLHFVELCKQLDRAS